jgi:hypothetical protein
MNIEKLSSVAELVSAIAIVVTLAYLAIETQQNTAAVQASVRQGMVDNDLEMIRMQLDFPVLFTGRSADADLSDEDLVRIHSSITALIRTRENQWLQYQNGVIDERTWRTYRTAITSILSTVFMRSWWRNRTALGLFDEGFVADVNKLLDENPIRPTLPIREQLGFDPL